MKYMLQVERIRTDIGFVTIEADSPEEAERKYLEPKVDEEVIFDDEIDWDDTMCCDEYQIISVEREGDE